MIEACALTKSYEKRKVVNCLSFAVAEKEAFALLGSNGAGKSTTIKMLLGLVRPDSGEVRLQGGKQVGYSPETPSFPPFLTGAEVLTYYARLQNIPKHACKAERETLLELVGLDAPKTRVKHYSKGMLQRLALAQALLGDPDVLLLDEPCAGLDAIGRIEMLTLLNRLKERGKTMLINSHILSDIEKVCDRGIILDKGEMLGTWQQEDLAEGQTLEAKFSQIMKGGV